MPRSEFSHIHRIGENYYRVFWQENGKQKSKYVRGSRDDAEIALAAIRLNRHGIIKDQTWNSYWKIAIEPSFNGLALKTISGYKRVWNKELQPRIGSTYISSTTWRYCQSVLDEINAPSVQQAAMRLWRKMCNRAVEDGILDRCPITRNTKLKPRNKREKGYIDVSAVEDFIETIHGIKYEGLILLELGGGLSPEEACAMVKEKVMRWEYQGRLYAIVTIDKALVTVDGKKHLKGPKNDYRGRQVVIGEPFASPLLALCEGKGALCPGPIKVVQNDYEEKHFASPATITHNWRDWCTRNGVPYVRPAAMRSIWSTWHGEAGSPDSVVSLAMGHSDGTTRGRNYQMSTKRGMILIADLLTDLILGEQAEPLWGDL